MIELIILVLAIFVGWFFGLRGISIVRDSEVGIVTRKIFGKQMPQGQIIACDSEVGIQADTLMPRFYWFNPIVWSVKKAKITIIPDGKIGIVSCIDGKQIPAGRLFGNEVASNLFQDAKAFLMNGGCKGPQINILRPGQYRINTAIFTVEICDVTRIPEGSLGVVIAEDGIPLTSEYMLAPEPINDCHHFQDGQSFIEGQGYRGPQLETLQPGQYYINPKLFTVEEKAVADVPPGYVAVIRSNVGKELEHPESPAPEISTGFEADEKMGEPLQDTEVLLTKDKKKRGIWKDSVAPGQYNFNPMAYTAYLVPTSNLTINWANHSQISESSYSGSETRGPVSVKSNAVAFGFDLLAVTSKDGFILKVEVQLVLRIDAPNAPYVISRFGTVRNLIDQVAHPLIGSSFRNEAGGQAAMQFVHSRTKLQEDALKKAQEAFKKHHVEVQNLLVGDIIIPADLLETQTKREIAVQRQTQYTEEAKSESGRIAVQENKARADKQPDVIAALLSVGIADDKAKAHVKEAEGNRDAIMAEATGKAFAERTIGEGIAAAMEAQANVLSPESMTLIKLMEAIAAGKLKIVPDVLVSGNGGQPDIMSAVMARLANGGNISLSAEIPPTKKEEKDQVIEVPAVQEYQEEDIIQE